MAVKCRNLLDLKSFESIKLVGGADGLDNIITWIYINQSYSIADWVHGGELVFITGLDGNEYNEEHLLQLIQECIDSTVSGVVILCNTNHITDIPQKVIELSNEKFLPLFKMPWRLPLVDVTKEISNLIVMNQFQERSVSNFFYEILFSDTFSEDTSKQLGSYCGIDVLKPAFVSTFRVYFNSNVSTREKSKLDSIITFLRKTLDDIFQTYSNEHISCVYGDSIVCYTCLNDFSQKKLLHNRLISQLKDFYKRYASNNLHIIGGMGTTYDNISNIHESYIEANHCIKYNMNAEKPVIVYYYEDLGIIQLIAKIKDTSLIKNYCLNVLGELICFDKEHNTNYMYTLSMYLHNDCNLINTSKALFIHRNTLVYRIDKIKQILNNDLSSMSVKAEYINVLKILQYFDIL